MKLKDAEGFAKGKANNADGYGGEIYRYAEAWADLMEAKIPDGATQPEIARIVVDNADQLSHDADTQGITGFMYGAAVSVLSAFWEHGEVLRRWHNKETQIGTEGDRANESGGVLNPAMLVIG